MDFFFLNPLSIDLAGSALYSRPPCVLGRERLENMEREKQRERRLREERERADKQRRKEEERRLQQRGEGVGADGEVGGGGLEVGGRLERERQRERRLREEREQADRQRRKEEERRLQQRGGEGGWVEDGGVVGERLGWEGGNWGCGGVGEGEFLAVCLPILLEAVGGGGGGRRTWLFACQVSEWLSTGLVAWTQATGCTDRHAWTRAHTHTHTWLLTHSLTHSLLHTHTLAHTHTNSFSLFFSFSLSLSVCLCLYLSVCPSLSLSVAACIVSTEHFLQSILFLQLQLFSFCLDFRKEWFFVVVVVGFWGRGAEHLQETWPILKISLQS